MNLPEKANLEKIYGENSACAARFQNLADNFARIYKHDHADFFTSPGRTEIIGNHVDHNGGKVIAGSINLDTEMRSQLILTRSAEPTIRKEPLPWLPV